MRNEMRSMMIPGLSRSRELEWNRQASMRSAKENLSRQAKSRIAFSMLGGMMMSNMENNRDHQKRK